MNLKPLQDWAVIRKADPEDRTPGGIIIPEVAKEKPLEGVILAIGPGKMVPEKEKEKDKGKEKKKKFVPTVLKPGQRVIYQKYSEREVEVGGETITLVREEDILGTVEGNGQSGYKTLAIEKKPEKPIAVRQKAPVPAAPLVKATVERTSPSAEKPIKQPSPKTAGKPGAGKTATKKATTGKPAAKKASKTVKKKPSASSPAKKKVKAPVKKSVAKKETVKKKAVVKKTAAKKATRPAAKKAPAIKTIKKKTAKPKGGKK